MIAPREIFDMIKEEVPANLRAVFLTQGIRDTSWNLDNLCYVQHNRVAIFEQKIKFQIIFQISKFQSWSKKSCNLIQKTFLTWKNWNLHVRRTDSEYVHMFEFRTLLKFWRR